MPAAQPSLLPGQSPPFFTVTPTDQAGVIVNVTAFCLVLAAISILIRAYVRFEINRQSPAWDDGVILAALGFFAIQSALIFHEVHEGLGKTLEKLGGSQKLVNLQKTQYADDVFYIIAVWITKISFALLFIRMSPQQTFQRVNHAVMGLVAVTGIVSILLITLRCDLSHPWIWVSYNGPSCTTALWIRWQVITAFDIFTEVIVAAMSIYLVWSLQLDIAKKAVVVFAFSLRLAVIAPTVCHLHYVSNALNSSDPTLAATSFVLCKQVEIAYAVIAANIPVLRPFILATTTNYGAPAEGPKASQGGTGGNSGSRSKTFSLKNLTNRSRRTDSNNNSALNRSRVDDDKVESYGANHSGRTNVSSGSPRVQQVTRKPSVGSDDSKQMIIRKDVQYSVAYGDGERGNRF